MIALEAYDNHMEMERWEKFLYYPIMGLCGVGVVVAIVWTVRIKSDFGREEYIHPPQKTELTQELKEPTFVRPEKRLPTEIPAEQPSATTGLRPLDKAPDKKLLTPNGTYERKGSIAEEDQYYFDEYTVERIKGPRHKPARVTDERSYIRWKVELGGSVSGVPVLSDGKLYFGCYDYQMLCLDQRTGEMVFQGKTWSQAIGDPYKYGGNIIIAQRNGNITAFDDDTGKRVWNHRMASDTPKDQMDISVSGISVAGGLIYVSKRWGNLYTLSAKNGLIKATPGVHYKSRVNLPAITFKKNVLFCNVAGELLCFDKTGKQYKWKYVIERGYPTTMKYASGKFLIATSEKEFFAMNSTTKRTLWQIKTAGWAFNALKHYDGTIYLSAGSLYAIDPADGGIFWELPSKGMLGFSRGAPVVENDSIYAAEEEGTLHKIDRKTGRSLKTYSIDGRIHNGIAKSGSLVFVSTTSKEIMAIDVSQ